MRKALIFTLLIFTFCHVLTADNSNRKVKLSNRTFSIAVMADPRNNGDSWKNALLEIRNRKLSRKLGLAPTELIIVAGDIDPAVQRNNDFMKIFANKKNRPVFLPVIGNHEFEEGAKHFRYVRDTLIPAIPHVVRRHASSCDYYLDYKNVRFIVVDQYTDLGKHGIINDEGRNWVEQIINASPKSIKHIFIAFHEPAFPRVRHVGDSFDQDPEQRNAFWQMLIKYRDRVRCVFVGHTHAYYRMKVLNPAGIEANDPNAYPNEDGGIYQIDAGAAGNGDINTIVQVQIEGKNVFVRVLQANNGANEPFALKDRWSIVEHP
ncbi:MAG: metallophosphoesterase [Chlamydiota bacterium]|nr:metallophosphoesterase [Chlamydiota bacterium]